MIKILIRISANNGEGWGEPGPAWNFATKGAGGCQNHHDDLHNDVDGDDDLRNDNDDNDDDIEILIVLNTNDFQSPLWKQELGTSQPRSCFWSPVPPSPSFTFSSKECEQDLFHLLLHSPPRQKHLICFNSPTPTNKEVKLIGGWVNRQNLEKVKVREKVKRRGKEETNKEDKMKVNEDSATTSTCVLLKNLWNPGENSTISVNFPNKPQLESISENLREKISGNYLCRNLKRYLFKEINLSKEKIWQQSWQFEEVTNGHGCLLGQLSLKGNERQLRGLAGSN